MAITWQELTKGEGVKRWMKRKRLPQDQEILPGAWSFAGPTLLANEIIVREANANLGVELTPEGYAGPNGVPSDFNRGLSVSGYGMDPLPIPIMDSSRLWQERGIATGFFSKEHEAIFDKLLDEMFGYHRPAPVRIRPPASSGLPFWTNSMEYKKPALLKALHNSKDICAGVRAREWERLLLDYDILLAYGINERQQADSGTWDGRTTPKFKERLVPDEAYARSGGEEGRLFAADKRVVIDGYEKKFHSAMRRRTVFGMSFVPNYYVTAVLGCMRDVYLERFEFTWKHRSFEHMTEKAKSFNYAVGSDVKNMDTNIPAWALRRMCDGLRRHLDDGFVDLVERMFFAPFVMPNPWRKVDPDYSPFFGDVPLSEDAFSLKVGLPSGIAINPDTGKFWMVFVYLCAMHDLGIDVLTDLVGTLQGKNERGAMLNMSDDCVMLLPTEDLAERFKAYKSPYAILEPEVPAQFLGGVFTRDAAGNLKVVPNIVTYFVNFFVPEQGIQRPSRKDTWSLGYLERRTHYMQAPMFKEMDYIIESAFKKTYGMSPLILAQLHNATRKATGLTAVDEMVLNNPHYLHYRVDPAEVSEQVLNLLVASIPPEEFYSSISHVFRSHNG